MSTTAMAQNRAATVNPAGGTQSPDTDLFWEQTARTRWGQYLTAIETELTLDAVSRLQSPGTGLDVGCEGGRWSRLLMDRGWEMTAIDVNEEALQRCQQRYPSLRCKLVADDDECFPVDDNSLDLLVCWEVPVVDRPWFVAEARRVLRPGGMMVGTLLNRNSWRGVLANTKSVVLRRTIHYTNSYPKFRETLREHDFELNRQRGCCWLPFGRHSDSPLVTAGVNLERLLGLQQLPAFSPWIHFTATRH